VAHEGTQGGPIEANQEKKKGFHGFVFSIDDPIYPIAIPGVSDAKAPVS
jgi:hypothetical protein